MKNKIHNSIHRTRRIILVAFASLALLATTAMAQEKGGELLLKLQRLSTPADIQKVEPGDSIVMSCPECKDIWVKVIQPPGKGGRKEFAIIARHQCPGCSNKFVTEGAGKDARLKIAHVCKHCGSEKATCCVMKKGTQPAVVSEPQGEHQH
ncbi:MAG: hypothetical protein ACYDC1_10825 [Limisphaerales bacterium]